MVGYAAALRVLTGYNKIDGQDMAVEALRPRHASGPDMVKKIIDFAVQVANEHLVPDGIGAGCGSGSLAPSDSIFVCSTSKLEEQRSWIITRTSRRLSVTVITLQ